MKGYIKWFAVIAVVGALTGCARTAPIDQVRTSVGAGHTQNVAPLWGERHGFAVPRVCRR
ncbi:hypothetical protein AACM93_001602 [Escherichia coli]|nr:hypothetical protein [Salmonella enterica]ECX2359162.1 hypothetical protein [Salmonella enterica subsp. enterica serovar Enteritidis]EDB4131669.1 hypothetical protein [Salmonella enterica subsp. enterica serovar Muenchen]EDR2104473.1 hypothetical protein [Salmonella enterica subsp. enterica]EFB8223043.1 hypothetical protein [Escherichia coli]BBS24590.1 hypothetical protein WP5W18E06_P10230 [Klebsiella quasipneumoniae]HDV5954795.1 hypothetical protein [Yersinia enterocolitica]